MDKNRKLLLESEIRKQKLKYIGSVVLAIIVVSALLVSFFPVSSQSILGTTKKLTAELSDVGNLPIAFVEIESGHIVKARHPVTLKYLNDKEVELLKTNTLIGVAKYRVIRYVE